MTSFGLICAGASSERFTLGICEACRDHQAQDKIVFVGVHPGSGSAKSTTKRLQKWGFKAPFIERKTNLLSEDIAALTQLFQGLQGITVNTPDVVLVVLDEQFSADSDMLEKSGRAIRTFTSERPQCNVIIIYFSTSLRQIPDLVPLRARIARDPENPFSSPLARIILITESPKFGTKYRATFARQLGILLTAEPSLTSFTPFPQQMARIKAPFIAVALDEVSFHNLEFNPLMALQERLPQRMKEFLFTTIISTLLDLVNAPVQPTSVRPSQQTSFAQIGSLVRKHGNEMLAIDIFTPPLHKDDRAWLDQAIEEKLDAYGVDQQSCVVLLPLPQPGTIPLEQFDVIACPTVSLVNERPFLGRIPIIKDLLAPVKYRKTIQVLTFFGIKI